MAAPSLRDVQRWMKAQIRPSGAANTAADVSTLLNPQRGTPGHDRLAVYASGYRVRIREALAEVYEAVRHVLGDRVFRELADTYAGAHASCDYNLSLTGRDLPRFLLSAPLTKRLPFLPDLARLEWAVCQAFHAHEQPPLDLARLAAITPETWELLRLIFQPSVSCVASAWPILDIWEARHRPRAAIDIPLMDRPQRVLVYRHGSEVRCRALEAQPYRVFERLVGGQPLGRVCEALAQDDPRGDPERIKGWFADWMTWGVVIGYAMEEGRCTDGSVSC